MKVKAKDLAREGGVGAPSVANDVRRGNLTRDEKKFFDLDNPLNQDWCIRKGINPKTGKKSGSITAKPTKEKPQKKKSGQDKKKTKEVEQYEPEPIQESDLTSLTGLPEKMLNMSIRGLVMQYGAPMQLKGYVEILDKIMSAQKKDVDIQQKRKDLIPIELVEYLKTFIDVFINQIFDTAPGIVREIIALAKADEKNAKIKGTKLLTRDVSKIAVETKKRINKEIRNLRTYDDAE